MSLTKSSLNQAKIQKAFSVFEKHYKLVPLEIFGNNPYKTLVSTLLSSRTNDDTTLPASQRLFQKAPNIKKLDQLNQLEIRNLIYPVGFYKVKSNHLKKLSRKVIANFNGKIPDTREELMSLPGVGRKTANLVLNRAFKKPAIAVDTHVHRISNLLGWVYTKTPQQTETQLIEFLPQKYWGQANRLMVSIGRQYRSHEKLEKFLKKEKLI